MDFLAVSPVHRHGWHAQVPTGEHPGELRSGPQIPAFYWQKSGESSHSCRNATQVGLTYWSILQLLLFRIQQGAGRVTHSLCLAGGWVKSWFLTSCLYHVLISYLPFLKWAFRIRDVQKITGWRGNPSKYRLFLSTKPREKHMAWERTNRWE